MHKRTLLSLASVICYVLAVVHVRKAGTRLRFGEWIAIVPAVPFFALVVTFLWPMIIGG